MQSTRLRPRFDESSRLRTSRSRSDACRQESHRSQNRAAARLLGLNAHLRATIGRTNARRRKGRLPARVSSGEKSFGYDLGPRRCPGRIGSSSLQVLENLPHDRWLGDEGQDSHLSPARAQQGVRFVDNPDPSELRELSSFRSLPRKAWNTPALAGNVFLVRNHQEATAFVLPTT